MPPRYLLLLLFVVILLVTIIQLEVFTIAFQKLGLSPRGALVLVLSALFGSAINIPIATIRTTQLPAAKLPAWGRYWRQSLMGKPGRTVLAVNLGGCIIPSGMSVYLLVRQLVDPLDLLLALAVVSGISYVFSRPITGVGIGMPVFVAPLAAVFMSLLLEPANAAPLAFSSGVLGVLLGADILRLSDVRTMGVPYASVGGAGTFDGIFLTGIIAVLLA